MTFTITYNGDTAVIRGISKEAAERVVGLLETKLPKANPFGIVPDFMAGLFPMVDEHSLIGRVIFSSECEVAAAAIEARVKRMANVARRALPQERDTLMSKGNEEAAGAIGVYLELTTDESLATLYKAIMAV